MSPQPANVFDSAAATTRLEAHFRLSTLEGLGDFSRAERSAAGAVLAYVEKTQIAERPALSRPVRESAAQTMFIDQATRANLEIVRTLSGEREGSLVKAIDRTVTGAGSRLLARRIMNPLTDVGAIHERLASIAWFLADTALLRRIREMLRTAPDMARPLSRLSLNRGGPRDLGAIGAGLTQARAIAAMFDRAGLPDELDRAVGALAARAAGSCRRCWRARWIRNCR